MRFKTCLSTGLLLCAMATATAASVASTPECEPNIISVHCGKTPSSVWHQQALWVVFVQNEHIYLVRSTDNGQSYSKPVVVNAKPETIEANGENRPKIAITDQAVLVSWTQKTNGPFTGDIRLARSEDKGKSFQPPKTINDDGNIISHRFDNLLAYPDGTVYVTWLDKRNKWRAEAKGKNYPGSGLFVASSTDHGKTFSKNFAVADNSCECCRIAVAPAAAKDLAIFWRHIYPSSKQGGSSRDHGFALVSAEGDIIGLTRATVDEWQINACPHHGPAMAAAANGTFHLAWFTNGEQRQGIFYGRFNPEKKIAEYITLMDASAGAGHPQVAELNGTVYFAWKLFDGKRTQIGLRTSNNSGKTWTAPRVLAVTEGPSDQPLLVKAGDAMILAWHTQNEGFRLIQIDAKASTVKASNSEAGRKE